MMINKILDVLCWGLLILAMVLIAKSGQASQYECYQVHRTYSDDRPVEVKTVCRKIYKKGTKPKNKKNKPIITEQVLKK